MRDSALFHSVIVDGLTNGATVCFRAEGDSMYPTIRHGETITVVAVGAKQVVRGDILLCRHGVRLLAHRVVAATASIGSVTFELRGDAKSSSDTPVCSGDVVGRVVAVRRNGRIVHLCGPVAQMRRAARSRCSAHQTIRFVEGRRAARDHSLHGADRFRSASMICRFAAADCRYHGSHHRIRKSDRVAVG